jgi:YbbR domain-containing protein
MPRFLRLAMQNWQLKLLAVALAVLLWIVVSAEQVTTSWISVPLVVQETDPSYRVVPGSAPKEVRVRFVGPGREFIDLAVRHPSLVLRLGEVASPGQAFALTPAMVRLPDGLEVAANDVDPGAVHLRFRRMAARDLPVRVHMLDDPAGEWAFAEPLHTTPTHVRVTGPAERLAGMTEVTTTAVAVPRIESTFQELVNLDLAPLRGLAVSTRAVRISGRAQRVLARGIPNVPVSVGAGVAIRPEAVDVAVRGSREAVAALRPGDFRVVLALDSIPTSLPAGGIPVALRVEGLAPGVSAVLSPDSVRLLPHGGDAGAGTSGDTGTAAPGRDE